MENNWVYIDEVIKLLTLNGVKELHVDTRSFSCLLLDKNSDADENCSIIRKLIKNQNALEENIIEQADVLTWVKEVENISGGLGHWRFLNFNTLDVSMGWLEYIRFYRYNEHQFIVCDSLSYPIEYRKCTADNLDGAFLNHY